jgi:hypothetical protein
MKELIKLARLRLKDEIAIVKRDYSNILTELTVEEKAVIYWYSSNGYEGINNILRESKGKKSPQLGILLNIALSKLPNSNLVVYRGIRFTHSRLKQYLLAFEISEPIVEYAFMSTSLRKSTATQFGTIILRIFSKNGKLIEQIAKFGLNSSLNEREILFEKGSQFIVLEIKEENPYFFITLEEI